MDDTTPPDALGRLRKIELCDRLRSEGCSEASALDAIGWSTATLHRWRRRYREQGLRGLAAGSRRPRATRAPAWTRADLPQDLLSAQVDGGSEFMADFEDACARLAIPLFVLPPKSPKPDGCVERANDSTRTELKEPKISDLTVAQASPALAEYQHFHNHVRPHMALDLRTPNEYLASL